MAVLRLDPIIIDGAALASALERDPFDELGYAMLARAGRMSEQVVAAVQRATPAGGLSLDDAVIGGLLVRMSKLTRAVFDATQADESEAHLALSRWPRRRSRFAGWSCRTTCRRFADFARTHSPTGARNSSAWEPRGIPRTTANTPHARRSRLMSSGSCERPRSAGMTCHGEPIAGAPTCAIAAKTLTRSESTTRCSPAIRTT